MASYHSYGDLLHNTVLLLTKIRPAFELKNHREIQGIMCYATTLVLYLAVWEVGCAQHRDHHGVPCPFSHVPTFWYSEVVAVYGVSEFAILRDNLMSGPA